MSTLIPYERWNPLTVSEVVTLFKDASFTWGLAGGYTVEQFLGQAIRQHDDIDVLVFRDEQLDAKRWFKGWRLYAADPPGTLREWRDGEYLEFGIHDIWGHREGANAWELQLMLAEVEGGEWFSRHTPLIRGKRDGLITIYNGLPCIRIEVQLLYKSRKVRPKDELDFQASLPLMSDEAKQWLKDNMLLLGLNTHPWLEFLG